MFGNKLYTYFGQDALDGVYEATNALSEPRRLTEICEHICNARESWFVDSEPLSNCGYNKLREIFMQRLIDGYGKIEVFGDEIWADTLYERIYGDEHIRAVVIEQFMEQILTLPGAESWNTIMDVWTEIQAMARSILDGEDDFDREDLHTEMENFVALIDAYFGWY